MQPLVSAGWLLERATQVTANEVIVLDTRWSLSGAAHAAYLEGHIPGAHFVDLDRELAAPPGPGRPGRHPLPSAATFGGMLGRVGYAAGRFVVAYDDMGGAIAARLWWLMRYFGLDGAAVLDGGLSAFCAAGGILTTAVPPPVNAPPPSLSPRPELVVDAGQVEALLATGRAVVIDARAAERYRGEVEPIDPRAGHIPGAVHGAFAGNLVDGRFMTPAALRERYAALGVGDDAPDAKVVLYCGSGVTACHGVLALELAGRSSLLYEGSWSDWSSDPERLVATGEQP